ncbi:hypothetical protein PIB30_099727 [Stylosanthes scabra]|uniref:Putative plant transposon protein domain-containing protein n=1 Tax=Stylosanthes scabra TaxID=79078 RepID=A0ABU6VYU6_9FABA|nr:hypothetical protein [Stylosanthes scabra]
MFKPSLSYEDPRIGVEVHAYAWKRAEATLKTSKICKKVLINPLSSLGTIPTLVDYYLIRCTCRIVANREKICRISIPGASWKLSSSQPPVPIQLRRTELQPLARGWQEFIIHSLVPTGNKSEITTSRAILIHTIMQGEDVRAEEIIAENMVTIAQGLGNKGNLAHPSTIYKLCKDAGVPLRNLQELQGFHH